MLKDLPSLIAGESCARLENLFYEGEGILRKRRGMRKIFTVSGGGKITMLERFGERIVFTYDTTLAVYDFASELITTIKTDFASADRFSGVAYGDYFFLSNGGDPVGYLDSALNFNFIAGAPKAKVLFVHNARLFAGNTDVDASEIRWCKQDSGTGVPFQVWTSTNNPLLPQDAGNVNQRGFGALRSLGALGEQIVALYDNGKAGFRLQVLDVSGVGLSQYVKVDFQGADFGGDTGAISTTDGLFYVNEFGVFHQKGAREVCISDNLGRDYLQNLDFSRADMAFLPNEKRLLVACGEESDVNNLVLYYDLTADRWGEITGWNIERFLRIGNELYGGDSYTAAVYRLFEGADDDGNDIWCTYETGELFFSSPTVIKKSRNFYLLGRLARDSAVNIVFDLWDKKNHFCPDKHIFSWRADEGGADSLLGVGELAEGEFASEETNDTLESFGHRKVKIKDYLKLRIKIHEHSQLPFEMNFLALDYETKKATKKNNLEPR